MPVHQHSSSKKSLQKKAPFSTSLTAQIDWLEFTVKGLQPEEVIKDVLQLDTSDFAALNKGRFGYRNQEKWNEGNIFILYNAHKKRLIDVDDSMGVHVLISGTGCDSYNSHQPVVYVMLLASLCPDSNFTRIDIAVDDIGERLLKFNRIYKQTLRKNYVTRWSKWDEVLSRKTSDGKFIGQTIYFGSQSSEIFCRIYNKALEQRQKFKEDDPAAEKIPKSWTRMEMVYRKERANLVAKHLMQYNNIGEVLRGTLQNYLRFIKPNGDTNKSRRPMIWWWERFISEARLLKLTLVKKKKTIEEMEQWIQKQIAPTLATIMSAKGGEVEWLYNSLNSGKLRMKKKHLEAITRYMKEEIQ